MARKRFSADNPLAQYPMGPTHKTSWLHFGICLLAAAGAYLIYHLTALFWLPVGLLLLSLAFSLSVKVAYEWEKAVVLRLGKYQGLRGPGHFWIIPFVDTVAYWIDQRVIATPFIAETTLTKDAVPVNVDAILFWMIWDAEKAALEVENYREAVAWTAQTALRDVVGRFMLTDILSGREMLDKVLQQVIDNRTEPWGITVQSVEIRDVIIPEALQEAMSREAQAERERRARIILGTAETEIAHRFAAAAKIYAGNPVALQLRAMNILYEGLKEKGGLVVTPSSVADSLNVGFMTAFQQAAAGMAQPAETGSAEPPPPSAANS